MSKSVYLLPAHLAEQRQQRVIVQLHAHCLGHDAEVLDADLMGGRGRRAKQGRTAVHQTQIETLTLHVEEGDGEQREE